MIWLIIIGMVIIALTIVLLPLLRAKPVQSENRTQQNIEIAQEQLSNLKETKDKGEISEFDYKVAREDIEKTLHLDLVDQTNANSIDSGSDYKTSGFLIVAFPVVVITLYYSLGSPLLLNVNSQTESTESSMMSKPPVVTEQKGKVADVKSMFEKLEKRLEQNPDDAQGWMMMGLTYMHFEQYDQAVDAYTKAVALLPNDSDAVMALNRAIKAQSGNDIETKAPTAMDTDTIEKKMIAPNGQTVDVGAMVMRLRAKLEANPENPEGWVLLGRSYSNLKRNADAVAAYEQALNLMPNNPEVRSLLNSAKTAAETE